MLPQILSPSNEHSSSEPQINREKNHILRIYIYSIPTIKHNFSANIWMSIFSINISVQIIFLILKTFLYHFSILHYFFFRMNHIRDSWLNFEPICWILKRNKKTTKNRRKKFAHRNPLKLGRKCFKVWFFIYKPLKLQFFTPFSTFIFPRINFHQTAIKFFAMDFSFYFLSKRKIKPHIFISFPIFFLKLDSF